MNAIADTMTLAEIFSTVKATFDPTPPIDILDSTVSTISVIINNIVDSLHGVTVNRIKFNPVKYHRRLVALFALFVSGSISVELSAEELHRVFCATIPEIPDDGIIGADERSALTRRYNFAVNPPPLAWYFTVTEYNFKRSQITDDVPSALLLDIIRVLDWLFYRNQVEWLDQNAWKTLFGEAMMLIMTACYVSDISPELLVQEFQKIVTYL